MQTRTDKKSYGRVIIIVLLRMAKQPPYPFIKWLGGKTKISGAILERLPDKCNTYYEPFVGGGAILIKMALSNRFKNAIINDKNPELINAWKTIKKEPELLILELRDTSKYLYDKEIYLKIRSTNPKTLDKVQAAARFIYLNKTCFNGLYRVNKSGEFNTPFGKYTNPLICDSKNINELSQILKKVKIISKNFDFVESEAKSGDAVYFDPPYIPISKTSNFSSYTSDKFGDEDHQRLAEVFKNLVDKNVRTVLSNSFCEDSMNLYGSYDISHIIGQRSIGGDVSYRNSVKEIIVYAGPKNKAEVVDC